MRARIHSLRGSAMIQRNVLWGAVMLGVMGIATAWTTPVSAQTNPPSAPPTGGRDLVAMTFAGTPVGSFPTSLERVDGAMEIVMRDGQPMLRATARSTFRVKLPEVLPHDFRLEFDLVPKTCCQPEDLAFEGTAIINQGDSSANVLWHHTHQMVVGGGPTHSSKIPDSIAVTLPGELTKIVFTMQGDNMTMFTNGKPLYSIQRKFVRDSVLRVFLGGQNDQERVVYLARLRVVANMQGPVTAVLVQGPTTATGMTVTAPGTNPAASPAAAASTQSPLRNAPAPYASRTTSMLSPPTPRTISLSDITAAGPSNTVSPRTIALTGISATGSLVAIVAIVPRTIALPELLAIGGLRTVRTAIVGVSSTAPAPRSITLGAVVASGGFATVPSVPSRTIALTAIAASGGFAMPRPRTITLTTITATGSRIP